jgi:hypothetical protein
VATTSWPSSGSAACTRFHRASLCRSLTCAGSPATPCCAGGPCGLAWPAAYTLLLPCLRCVVCADLLPSQRHAAPGNSQCEALHCVGSGDAGVSVRAKPLNQLAPLPSRRGPHTDLAALIDVFPAAARPELRAFTREELQAAFALQPGAFELPEVRTGPANGAALFWPFAVHCTRSNKPPLIKGNGCCVVVMRGCAAVMMWQHSVP